MPRYAAITLGSNSFNMLVAHTVGGKPTVVAKYKRKVRLAQGIGDDGVLSDEAFERGIDCLTMFAQMLDKEAVDRQHVAVIATATLRNISNAQAFKDAALPILQQPIEVISGMREAELIYQGMAATTAGSGRRLVIDIGGASTEFIVGDGNKVLFKQSLPIGCVTFNSQFFNEFPFQVLDFEAANTQVKTTLGEYADELRRLGWHGVVGASGSVQAVTELLNHRGQNTSITAEVLQHLQLEILSQDDASMLGIDGIHPERAPTFAAGVAILQALFSLLNIDKLNLSGGALREGVLQILADRVQHN